MKEPVRFRFEYEQLLAAMKGKKVLTITEAAKYVGKSRDWCYTHLKFTDGQITTSSLAWQLAEM